MLRPSPAPTECPNGEAVPPVAPELPRPPMVLVVDDDPAIREFVRTVLHHAGYGVLEAGLGKEAVQVCTDYPGKIHLLIADIMLPGMNGGELAALLHALRPQMRVLYISGYDYAFMVVPAEVPAAYLQKPISPGALIGKVGELVGRRDGPNNV